MIKIMKSSKSLLSKKNLKYLGFFNSNEIDIIKAPEENLSNVMYDIVYLDKLTHLPEPKFIYDLLIKIKYFRQYILLYNFDIPFTLNIIRTGILTTYKLNDVIYKKETYPKFFYLLLSGKVSLLSIPDIIINPGSFFGEEIFQHIRYKYTAVSTSDKTILLSIPKDFAITNILEKIINTNENIEKTLQNSFEIFKSDRGLYQKHLDKMVKLFPKLDEVVISNKDNADAIFVIYNGLCLLNDDNNQNLILLDKGNIVGSESLVNIDENGEIKNNKYLYNLTSKYNNTIIFKFFIKDLNEKTLNALTIQLSTSFIERNNFIQKSEISQQLNKKRLMSKYTMFKKKENINDYISHCMIKKFSPKKAEHSFNHVLKKIRLKEDIENDKQRLTVRTCLFKRNINNIFKKKINQSKSHKNMIELNSKNKKYSSFLNLVKKEKIIKNNFLESLGDLPENKEEQKEENTNNLVHKNSFNSNKNPNILDNSANNSFFFTAVAPKKTIYKKIEIIGKKHESALFSKRLRKKNSLKENSAIKDTDYTKLKSLLSSDTKDSYQNRNFSLFMPEKKQVENFGFPVLDTIHYFNFGYKYKNKKDNKSEKKVNKEDKSCIFYETKKFNIPLFIFCKKKEKVNFDNFQNIN